MSEIIFETTNAGYTIVSSISEDGFGFRAITPVEMPEGFDRREHFEAVRPMMDMTAGVYVGRNHFSEEACEPWYRAAYACLKNSTYISFVDKDTEKPLGGVRIMATAKHEQSNAEKEMDILLEPRERMEIGAFFIDKSLPILVRKRIAAEVCFAIVYFYANVIRQKPKDILAYTTKARDAIFSRWGFTPVRKYHDRLRNKDIVISDDAPNNRIVHRPLQKQFNKDAVLLEYQINSQVGWFEILRRASGYSSDHPMVRRRLYELNLHDLVSRKAVVSMKTEKGDST